MHRISLCALACLLAALFCGSATAQEPANRPTEAGQTELADRAALEREFAEKLTGSALVGRFTIDGKDEAKDERYEISEVKKVRGDRWSISTRIRYGDTDVNVPLVLPIYWAGNTPVISLTDFAIPGLGTFTARVMIYGDRYAGTWQHGEVGGHLWGRVVKEEKPKE